MFDDAGVAVGSVRSTRRSSSFAILFLGTLLRRAGGAQHSSGAPVVSQSTPIGFVEKEEEEEEVRCV